MAYGEEHAPGTRGATPMTIGYNIAALLPYWGKKTLADVRKSTCEGYSANRRASSISDETIRRELSVLSAAIGHWNAAHGPLDAVPVVTMPEKPPGRDRWLTRSEAALLVAAALGFYRVFHTDLVTRKVVVTWRRHRWTINRHVARFILLGLATGTRPGAIAAVQWNANLVGGWIDLDRGVMHRRGRAETESKKKRPPVKLGRRILAHLRRWKRMDERAQAALLAKVEASTEAQRERRASAYRTVISYEGLAVEKIRRGWATAVELAWLEPAQTGLDKVTPHTLRHTRATWTMQAGVDLWEASGFLGMSPKTLIDVYGHHHPDWQKNAAEI